MSEIAETYQQQQSEAMPESGAASFATVAQVHEDGLSLIFDGEGTVASKHYKCNQYCKFEAGQRVYLQKDGGTYVVLFPVGAPNSSVAADTAAKADSATKADTATSADSAAKADTAIKADSATKADKATKADSATKADTASKADTATSADTLKDAYRGYAITFRYYNSKLQYRIGSGSYVDV